MLQFFRNFFSSRFGAFFAIALLILIALAFASGDVANTGSFGGIAGGDRAATVGGKRIDTSTLSQAATSTLERVKENDPTMSMKAFLANDGLDQVLDDLTDRMAIAVFGEEHGIVAGDRLVDSEIAQMPAFRGPDGKFSEELFRQMMQQRGMGEQLVREDLRQGLIARQVMVPASIGAAMPKSMAKRYAALLTEKRSGEIALLPAMLFAAKDKPTDDQVTKFYQANQDDFIRPERRIIRYATFGEDILQDIPEPTEAEIAFRYNADKANYAASEKRRITQLIVPTEAAAQAVVAEIAKGGSLESSAKAKGLAANSLEFFSRAELAGQTSKSFADAVFAASSGSLAKPASSGLGWHVARVDEIRRKPGRSLDQVREELTGTIREEKQRVALTEQLERIEDSFDDGESLSDVAETLGAELKLSKPVTADGQVYLSRTETVPAQLRPVLDTAFTMEQEEPQLAEVERGKTFAIFEVTEIAASAAAPLDEIKDAVTAAYVLENASAQAKLSARKVQQEVVGGKTLGQALATLKRRLPPVQKVTMSRSQLSELQRQRQQVPPPVALMFNMAAGTTKVQPAPNGQGWFIVSLRDITPGKVADDNPIIATAQAELGRVTGQEYTDALGRAIRNQVGVERNEDGIRTVREQLGGGS